MAYQDLHQEIKKVVGDDRPEFKAFLNSLPADVIQFINAEHKKGNKLIQAGMPAFMPCDQNGVNALFGYLIQLSNPGMAPPAKGMSPKIKNQVNGQTAFNIATENAIVNAIDNDDNSPASVAFLKQHQSKLVEEFAKAGKHTDAKYIADQITEFLDLVKDFDGLEKEYSSSKGFFSSSRLGDEIKNSFSQQEAKSLFSELVFETTLATAKELPNSSVLVDFIEKHRDTIISGITKDPVPSIKNQDKAREQIEEMNDDLNDLETLKLNKQNYNINEKDFEQLYFDHQINHLRQGNVYQQSLADFMTADETVEIFKKHVLDNAKTENKFDEFTNQLIYKKNSKTLLSAEELHNIFKDFKAKKLVEDFVARRKVDCMLQDENFLASPELTKLCQKNPDGLAKEFADKSHAKYAEQSKKFDFFKDDYIKEPHTVGGKTISVDQKIKEWADPNIIAEKMEALGLKPIYSEHRFTPGKNLTSDAKAVYRDLNYYTVQYLMNNVDVLKESVIARTDTFANQLCDRIEQYPHQWYDIVKSFNPNTSDQNSCLRKLYDFANKHPQEKALLDPKHSNELTKAIHQTTLIDRFDCPEIREFLRSEHAPKKFTIEDNEKLRKQLRKDEDCSFQNKLNVYFDNNAAKHNTFLHRNTLYSYLLQASGAPRDHWVTDKNQQIPVRKQFAKALMNITDSNLFDALASHVEYGFFTAVDNDERNQRIEKLLQKFSHYLDVQLRDEKSLDPRQAFINFLKADAANGGLALPGFAALTPDDLMEKRFEFELIADALPYQLGNIRSHTIHQYRQQISDELDALSKQQTVLNTIFRDEIRKLTELAHDTDELIMPTSDNLKRMNVFKEGMADGSGVKQLHSYLDSIEEASKQLNLRWDNFLKLTRLLEDHSTNHWLAQRERISLQKQINQLHQQMSELVYMRDNIYRIMDAFDQAQDRYEKQDMKPSHRVYGHHAEKLVVADGQSMLDAINEHIDKEKRLKGVNSRYRGYDSTKNPTASTGMVISVESDTLSRDPSVAYAHGVTSNEYVIVDVVNTKNNKFLGNIVDHVPERVMVETEQGKTEVGKGGNKLMTDDLSRCNNDDDLRVYAKVLAKNLVEKCKLLLPSVGENPRINFSIGADPSSAEYEKFDKLREMVRLEFRELAYQKAKEDEHYKGVDKFIDYSERNKPFFSWKTEGGKTWREGTSFMKRAKDALRTVKDMDQRNCDDNEVRDIEKITTKPS